MSLQSISGANLFKVPYRSNTTYVPYTDTDCKFKDFPLDSHQIFLHLYNTAYAIWDKTK